MTPRPIPASVRTLLPLCGAENDHEALGACRGVGRKLQAAGLDWHALAAAIPAAERVGVDTIVPPAGQADGFSRQREDLGGAAQFGFSRRPENPSASARIRPFDAYAWKRAYTPRQEAEHRARVRFCQDRAWRLTAWERQFVNSVSKLHGNLSIRQGDCLTTMTDRLDMEARRPC
ncbi:hypothetical protein R1A27_34360 (plasmid) [Methylobacterium sp. NMS12]|uniref:hypothetical protein n=1 Tax=Methylobacterium sp. NMS12 TaxID=3079766 RepID=UPI003F8828A1